MYSERVMTETETYFNLVIQSMHKADKANKVVEIKDAPVNMFLEDKTANRVNPNELEIKEPDYKVALLIGVSNYSNLKQFTDKGLTPIYDDIT